MARSERSYAKPVSPQAVADFYTALETAFCVSPLGMAIIDAEGHVLSANSALVRMLGSVPAGWSDLPAEIREAAADAARGPVERRLQHGAYVSFEARPSQSHWVVFAQDVTAVKEMQATLELDAERLRKVAALHRIVEQAEFELDEVLEWIVDRARSLLDASGVAVGLIEGDVIIYRIATGTSRAGIRTPVGGSLSGMTVRSGSPQLCLDSEADPRVDVNACRAAGLRSMVIAPLRHRGQVVGVLNVTSPAPETFSAKDVPTVELIAGAVSAAYSHTTDLATKRALLDELQSTVAALRHSESQLAHKAVHDPLTGLPNRALFSERLRSALAQSERQGNRLAVMFLDLDHFKSVNDTLGHEAGDQLLIEISRRLQSSIRAGDTGSRFGGDEFTVLCDNLTGIQDAEGVAQRIIDAVSQVVALPSGSVTPTISIGVALNDEPGLLPDELLRRADVALYRAKQSGRACYVVYAERPPPLP